MQSQASTSVIPLPSSATIPAAISVSYRAKSKGSEKQICLNLTQYVVEHLRLEGDRHFVVRKKDNTYTITFSDKMNARSRKVPAIKKDTMRVEIFLDTKVIQINEDDNIKAVRQDILMSEDGNMLTFEFDVDEFLKPKPLAVTRMVESKDDKIEYGFKPDSSWGLALEETIDALMVQKRLEYFARKFGNI